MKIFQHIGSRNRSVTLYDEEDRKIAEGSTRNGQMEFSCHGKEYVSHLRIPHFVGVVSWPITGTILDGNGTPEFQVTLEFSALKLRSERTDESVEITLFDRHGVVTDLGREAAFAKDSFRNYLSVRRHSLASLPRLLIGKPVPLCEGTYRGDSHGILIGLILLEVCYRPNAS